MPTIILIGSACFFVWLLWKLIESVATSKRRAPYPPGPKPKPIIGNLLDFPTAEAPRAYVEWGKKYNSDLIYASALGHRILVINKLEDAEELLERRASKYSSRPVMPVTELIGWGYNFSLYPHGDKWRLHRRLSHQYLRPEAARKYYPLLRRKSKQLLQDLLKTPQDFDNHNIMYSRSIAMESMYGYEMKSFDEPFVVAAERGFTLGEKFYIPGGTLINFIPALAYIPPWFPGASYQKLAAEVRRLSNDMQRLPMELVKKNMEEGTAIPSFVSEFLAKKHRVGASQEEEKAVGSVASTIYIAASDTTISATMTFFYLIATHPDIQRKAQAEIDRVIGSERLPDFEDRNSLPYVEAIYREVLRFRPSLPTAVPHALSEDDNYKGYFIPKGTIVFGNIWAMTHDEEVYPEPFKFKPERFFDENGKLNDDRVLAFGFGRRICSGKHVGSAMTWILIASVLASFEIGPAKDESGNDIEINDEYESCGNSDHKTKFKCSIVPRSPMARQLIEDATDLS